MSVHRIAVCVATSVCRCEHAHRRVRFVHHTVLGLPKPDRPRARRGTLARSDIAAFSDAPQGLCVILAHLGGRGACNLRRPVIQP